jgi:hypothetical protein
MAETDYYTTLHRSMFARINEVGAKPFLLFQYYLTYKTAPRINPSLKTIALDMGIVDKNGKAQISAVSHLKKELIEAGWIQEIDGEIQIILVEKNSTVEKISSRKLRKSQQVLRKSQVPYIRTEKEKEIKLEKENLSPRETPKVSIGRQTGILAADLIESDEKHIHTQTIVDGLKERLGTPFMLPKEFEWIATINFAWLNEFSAERYLETFDLLEKIRKKKRGEWRVTPAMIEKNIADKEKLEIELGSAENGSNQKPNNGNKRTDADVFAESADFYQQWEQREAGNFPN